MSDQRSRRGTQVRLWAGVAAGAMVAATLPLTATASSQAAPVATAVQPRNGAVSFPSSAWAVLARQTIYIPNMPVVMRSQGDVNPYDDTVFVPAQAGSRAVLAAFPPSLDDSVTVPLSPGDGWPSCCAAIQRDDTVWVTWDLEPQGWFSSVNGRGAVPTLQSTSSGPVSTRVYRGIAIQDDTLFMPYHDNWVAAGAGGVVSVNSRTDGSASMATFGSGFYPSQVLLVDDTLFVTNMTNVGIPQAGPSYAIDTRAPGSPEPVSLPWGTRGVTSSDDSYVFMGQFLGNKFVSFRADSIDESTITTVTGAVSPKFEFMSSWQDAGADDTVFIADSSANKAIWMINSRTLNVDDSVTLDTPPAFITAARSGVAYASGGYSDGNKSNFVWALGIVSATPSSLNGVEGDDVTVNLSLPEALTADDSTVKQVWWGDDTVPFTPVTGQNKITVTVPAGSGTRAVSLGLNGGNRIQVGTFTYGATPGPNPDPVFPPSAPQRVTAVAGDTTATVSWSAPAAVGSFPVTTYRVVAGPGGASCLTASLTCVITGLTNGVTYTFTVEALNGAGWGPRGGPSNPVTPGGVTPAPPPQPVPGPVPPGDSVLTVDGATTPVEVDPKPDDKGLEVTGDGWTMTLDGLGPDGQPLNLGPNGALILEQERDVRSTGTGFLGKSEVDLYVDPPVLVQSGASRSWWRKATSRSTEGIYVGTLPVNAAGAFEGIVTLPSDIEAGEHILQAVGVSPTGQTRALSLGIIVSPWITLDQGVRKPAGMHDRIRTSGDSKGIPAGVKLTPYIKYRGQSAFQQGKATITVQSDGSFKWTRQIRKDKGLTAYVAWTDIESNRVFWAKVR